MLFLLFVKSVLSTLVTCCDPLNPLSERRTPSGYVLCLLWSGSLVLARSAPEVLFDSLSLKSENLLSPAPGNLLSLGSRNLLSLMSEDLLYFGGGGRTSNVLLRGGWFILG